MAMIALSIATSTLADTITLRSEVIIADPESDVRLAQIAELEGPEAQRLAELVVMPRDRTSTLRVESHDAELRGPTDSRQHLTVQEIRELLTQAGAHWGRINLQGGAVNIRFASHEGNGPAAMVAVSLSHQPRPRQEAGASAEPEPVLAGSIIDEQTLRGEMARLFCSKLRVKPADLQLSLDASDASILSQSLDGARFEIQPTSVFASDRATIVVRKWVDGQVAETWNITVCPVIRVRAAASAIDLRKGNIIHENDIEMVEEWLPAGQASAIAAHDLIVGRIATTNVRPGELIRRADIQRQRVVQRGDRVMVRCLVGGSVITMQAEARSDGGEGDVIELRKIGERSTFYATVTGPREVVVDLTRPVQQHMESSRNLSDKEAGQ